MPGIRLNIGLVYYKQADYKHAIQPFASVLRYEPDSAQARYLLGLCDFFTEHYADAAQTLEPLWTEQSGNLNYLYVLSISANKSGRTELDQRATTRLIEVGQNSAEFHLILGVGASGPGALPIGARRILAGCPAGPQVTLRTLFFRRGLSPGKRIRCRQTGVSEGY